jgi:hypothetical protein
MLINIAIVNGYILYIFSSRLYEYYMVTDSYSREQILCGISNQAFLTHKHTARNKSLLCSTKYFSI